ncbi:MAG: cyclic nucleotide-binding domain-containing protein [Deltaproteobacteria bacterium]|nr:cyclic nucleotide-binding domain-containing protein [Deltaproteobacteria bacterium]
MIIQKADLFRDLSQETVSAISTAMTEEAHEQGSLLFKAGEPAKNFYLIVEGRVRLSIGTEGRIDYTASVPGEAFGWTGMVDRPAYVATAECLTSCKLVKVEKDKLNQVFTKDPQGGMIFFKRLAGAVVQRLIDNYNAFLSAGSLSGVTYGTEQVVTSTEDEQ